MNDESNKMQQNEIIFRMGEETGIVIEKSKEQFEHSLFREQYRQVFDIIDSIIERSTRIEPHQDIDDKMSNVIVFCGDRGEGKTSALETVRGILSNKTIMKNAKDAKLYSSERIDSDSFKVLRLVDPAFFDSKHNLLELLIGQMYADICDDDKRKMEEDECPIRCNENIANRNRLMEKFQKVKRSLAIINKASDKNAYDDLEEIDDLAAGIELKNKFNAMLHCYAQYFHKERVLISIDDLDINATEGYQMAEEIRKYLSSPENCVVLVAVKIEQMIEVIQSYLRKRMDKEVVSNETIKEMAIKYVMKFIPESHRVWMPNGSILTDSKLKIYENNEPKEEFESVKEAVVRLIYRKTRYIFVNTRNVSPIVPRNLRELRLLWATLWTLNDGEKNDENHIKNKTIFKQYFYNVWVKSLQNDDVDFVEALTNNDDLVSINKSIIAYLTRKYKDVLGAKSNSNTNSLLDAILNPNNMMQNLSTGDVMYVVSTLENLTADTDTHRLLFFIKAFYSITLYESYDEMTIDNNHIYAINNDTKISIYKYDKLYRKLNALQRFLNGSYFTYEPEDILPKEAISQKPRDMRYINPELLRTIYEELINNTPETLDDYEIKLNTLEFFALTTTNDAYSDDEAKTHRRLQSSPIRVMNIRPKAKRVAFDVLSIFYNIINIKHTYERWNDFYRVEDAEEQDILALENQKSEAEQEQEDNRNQQKPSLFALAQDYAFSLYNKMLRECADFATPMYTPEHYLVSDAAIRFIDVQLAIIDLALYNKNVHHVSSNKLNIRLLYKDIQELGVSLYPIKEGDQRYELKFHFLTPIKKYLEDISAESFDKIFNSDSLINFDRELLKKVVSLVSLLSVNLSFPIDGVTIHRQIRRSNPELYKECGGLRYWNKVIKRDKTYNSLWDLIPGFTQSKEYMEVLINNEQLIDRLGVLA